MPIPKEWTLDSYNIYSEGDILIKDFKEKFEKDPGPYSYNSLPVPKERTTGFFPRIVEDLNKLQVHGLTAGLARAVDYILHDHSFASETYQKALTMYLAEVNKKLRRGDYDSKAWR